MGTQGPSTDKSSTSCFRSFSWLDLPRSVRLKCGTRRLLLNERLTGTRALKCTSLSTRSAASEEETFTPLPRPSRNPKVVETFRHRTLKGRQPLSFHCHRPNIDWGRGNEEHRVKRNPGPCWKTSRKGSRSCSLGKWGYPDVSLSHVGPSPTVPWGERVKWFWGLPGSLFGRRKTERPLQVFSVHYLRRKSECRSNVGQPVVK